MKRTVAAVQNNAISLAMNSDSAKLVVIPTDALLAHRVGYFGDDELFVWATEYAAEHPELDHESAIFELLWLDPKMANREDNRLEALISAFAREYEPAFKVDGHQAEATAQHLFRTRLQDYLNDQCRPWDVCRMIGPIEDLFDPDWLGGMWNACDWIDSLTAPADCRYLEDAIRECLSNLDQRTVTDSAGELSQEGNSLADVPSTTLQDFKMTSKKDDPASNNLLLRAFYVFCDIALLILVGIFVFSYISKHF